MENDAVKDAIMILEKQKAAIEEALLHLTAAVPQEITVELTEIPDVETKPFKLAAETRRRMSVAHKHRWDLLRKKAAIERELQPAHTHRKAS